MAVNLTLVLAKAVRSIPPNLRNYTPVNRLKWLLKPMSNELTTPTAEWEGESIIKTILLISVLLPSIILMLTDTTILTISLLRKTLLSLSVESAPRSMSCLIRNMVARLSSPRTMLKPPSFITMLVNVNSLKTYLEGLRLLLQLLAESASPTEMLLTYESLKLINFEKRLK